MSSSTVSNKPYLMYCLNIWQRYYFNRTALMKYTFLNKVYIRKVKRGHVKKTLQDTGVHVIPVLLELK